MARHEQVLALWCALTGHDPEWFEEPEREALLARTEIAKLAEATDAVLLYAGRSVCRGTSLPLERWLAAARLSA
ncbi:hypothetical protein [Cryptosporangium arvum]|uniref:Uncharacterized protein n=1 Tax=Cryptosporangium arvum DSM 44712 TaxID=927661 RepID=A0A010Z0A9_9ACTN|nr:hypothetical protein [Cryptosporangium arvum]EXG80888.1 hypothetical protein CryarDRAFT_1983 [Cryptosporangium arvum DSM 44712]